MKSFFHHFIAFIILLLSSYLLRTYFFNHSGHEQGLGPFGIKVLTNSSFIFGLFEDSGHFVRIVVSAVSLGIISLIFCYFYAFLSNELVLLRWAMTLMLAGFFGNALEKILFGFVLDYISLFGRFAFNFNDVVQISGFLICIREFFTKEDIIWFPNMRRQRLLVYKDVQLSILVKILGLVFIGNLTQLILAATLLFPYMSEKNGNTQGLYILSFFLLNLLILPIVGLFLVKELLKCVGPMFALERHLSDPALDGKSFKLRKTDYFMTLEVAFNDFISRNLKK